MKHLDAKEVVRGTADDTLNSILETLESLEYGHFTDALRYVALVEEGMEKVREQAVMDAALGGESATAMSEALGGSRQTFYNKYANLIKKARKQRDEDTTDFDEFADAQEKRSTIRFINGEIQATTDPLDASYEPLDDYQQAFEKSFRNALETQLTAPNGEWKAVVKKALLAHVLPTNTVLEIKDAAQRYATGAYLTNEYGEPYSIVNEGTEFYRLSALNKVNPKAERKEEIRKAYIAMVAAEDKACKAACPTETDPFDGFGLPAEPAAAKLPDNLVEVWENYQSKAKAEGKKPTRENFAKLYGVSRATFSRALKKAEAEQNEQEA